MNFKSVNLIAIFLFGFSGCSKITIPLRTSLPSNRSLVIVKTDEANLYFLKDDVLEQLHKEIVGNKDSKRLDSISNLMRNYSFDTLSFHAYGKSQDTDRSNFYSTSFIWITPLLNQGKVWVLSKKTNGFGSSMVRRKMRKNKLFYLSTGEIIYLTPGPLY